MATKRRKQNRRRRTGRDLFEQVRRNFEKGKYKQALKDAKVCFRESPTEEHRRFLECAHMGRAQQLLDQGLIEQCRGVLRSLIDLGVTEPAVRTALPEMALAVGVLDQLPAEWRETATARDNRFTKKAADLAVRRPQSALPELRQHAHAVHEALGALEHRDEGTAFAKIKGIPRESPFADWKLFVRGLAAYYRNEPEVMSANWKRLDPHRAAFRIAAPLQVVQGTVRLEDADGPTRAGVAQIERGLASRSLLNVLVRLRDEVTEENWSGAFQELRSVRRTLRREHPDLYERLVAWLCRDVIAKAEEIGSFRRLQEVCDPLPLDPDWNRARAMFEESFDGHIEEEDRYWRRYVSDLARCPDLSDSDRALAQALVWLRLGRNFARDADGWRTCACGQSHDQEVDDRSARAAECFDQAVRLAPDQLISYKVPVTTWIEIEQREQAASASRRLLDRFPDDLDTLIFLADYSLEEGRPADAAEFAERARELKPLDQDVARLAWTAHLASVVPFAAERQFDKGRAAFEAAEAIRPGRARDYDVLARKAVFEDKAGNAAEAERLLQTAQRGLANPQPLWLAMTLECERFNLRGHASSYEKRWIASLKGKRDGRATGLMCQLLADHTRRQASYNRPSSYAEQLVQYVSKCTRLRKWEPDGLRGVCEFLQSLNETSHLKKFVKKGLRQFPDVPFFHWAAGELEFERGTFRARRTQASQSYRRAIELAGRSNDPDDRRIRDLAKQRLITIDSGPGPRRRRPAFFEDDEDEFFEEDNPTARRGFAGGPLPFDPQDLAGLSDKQVRDLAESIMDRFGIDLPDTDDDGAPNIFDFSGRRGK